MKRTRVWILVADGSRAKFMHLIDRKTGAVRVDDQSFSSAKGFTRELGRAKPGRVHDSHGRARHAIQPRVDLHEQAEKAFLQDVIRKLSEAHEGGAFDDLIIAAPPRALGVLREIIPERLRGHVVREITGDFTRCTEQEVSRVVVDHMHGTERAQI